ncbi:asparaginase [Pseudalkalibacillus caeni]|uniref:Asparaginase n=1 Tax=Exobacillus caeni TaxID=2574798 RepID=A0A5R9FCN0_9BACL|nr:asparaginase [Pseudalkalibacillus caeni]TLS38633.1 asparaginase [Pseudalkalibacillus caeni]
MTYSVEIYRGNHLESTHQAHIAVVNYKGELLYSHGDPYRLTFPRSSMKPFQAIPLIETGTADFFNYHNADISVSCASHSGEPFHRSRVSDILARIGLQENDLQCGTHIPRDHDSYIKLIKSGKELTPLYSNCSGKHSGMLATAVKMGEDYESYREPNHPVQRRIMKAISETCNIPEEKIQISVDGCGVPVHRLPLYNAALGFSRLAAHTTIDDSRRQETLKRIKEAMTEYPEMVAGTDRFDTDLMRTFKGKIVAKAGAEGVQCLGVSEEGIGIAIKMEDGNARACSAVTLEVLKQLGIGDKLIMQSLENYINPPVLNMRKDKIGVIKPVFKLNGGTKGQVPCPSY